MAQEQIIMLIGAQTVEITALRIKIAELEQKIAELEKPEDKAE